MYKENNDKEIRIFLLFFFRSFLEDILFFSFSSFAVAEQENRIKRIESFRF